MQLPSRPAHTAAAFAAAVMLSAGAIIIVGAVAGARAWLGAALGGAIAGAALSLVAVTLAGRGRGLVQGDPRRRLDPVTGLPDARRLERDLERRMSGAQAPTVLFVCVLRGLGQYNDAYGEACGDAMLGWLARRLVEAVGERGRAYRLRGGSFAVLAGAAEYAGELAAACRASLLEVGEGFMIGAALGTVALPAEAIRPAAAIEIARRRALVARETRAARAENMLGPPDDPMDVVSLMPSRYEVAEMAARIGRRMGAGGHELEELEAAAHLRDVGNMAVPSDVLARPGELPGPEWEFIRLHTLVGERLLAANFGMETVGRLVRSSHERWDGGGYPDGLRGQDIPLGSRIVFVCCAFEDMTCERPHRAALTAGQALQQLALGAGSQFDPGVVQAFQEEFAAGAGDLPGGASAGARRPLLVLVADDDPAARFLLTRAIEAAGHECVAVADGPGALRMLRRRRPDVVICDSHLPRASADQLCRRLRADEDEDAPYVYFVACLALQAEQPVRADLGAGADDFLTKPFDREELERLLASAAHQLALRRDGNLDQP